MKTIHFTLLLAILMMLTAPDCKKQSDNPVNLLPPVTDTGANTFGCLISGLALLPRDGVATVESPYPHNGIEVVFDCGNKMFDINIYNERVNSPAPFYLHLHFVGYDTLKQGNCNWQLTSFNQGTLSYPLDDVYGSFFDQQINNYQWYGSYETSGTTIITRFDTINHIVAGTFSGRLREKSGTSEVTVTDGRFDINWATLADKKFP